MRDGREAVMARQSLSARGGERISAQGLTLDQSGFPSHSFEDAFLMPSLLILFVQEEYASQE
jgi:hypothetical protein